MDKIVITTDHTEPNSYLIRCLSLLFPGCAIEVVNKESDISETSPIDSVDQRQNDFPQYSDKLANF